MLIEKLSLVQRCALIKDYKKGSTNVYLEKKYGVSHGLIYRVFKNNNVNLRTLILSPAQKCELIKDYKKGRSYKELKDKYGTSRDLARAILKRSGIQFIQYKTKLSLQQERELVRDYKDGKSHIELAKKYSISKSIVYNIIGENNVKLRWGRTKAIDETFFEKINKEEKAYWLGFIMADGWISKTTARVAKNGKNVEGYRFGMNCAEEDRAHLYKFLKNIKSEHKVGITRSGGYKQPNRCYYVIIGSKKIYGDLSKYMDTRKSYTAKPYKNLSSNLERHYWRGVFDGDGGFCKEKNKLGYKVVLVGTYAMCAGFEKFIRKKLHLNKKKVYTHDNIYEVDYGKTSDVVAISKLLYNNCKVFLDRKDKIHKTIEVNIGKLKLNKKYWKQYGGR